MEREIVIEELRRIIEEIIKGAKEDRLRLKVERGDIGTDERNEVLLVLRYLGYVVREKDNEYIIHLDKKADKSMWLRLEQVILADNFPKAKEIRRLSKTYVEEWIDEKVAIIETDIYLQRLSKDKKDYVVKKIPNDKELNDILIKELEQLGYKVQETLAEILINPFK